MRLVITTEATEPIAECAVRSLYIVVFPPAFDDDLCFSKGVEERSVQQFVAEPGIEALDRALLPRAARYDDGCLCTDGLDPVANSLMRAQPHDGRSRVCFVP